MGLTKPAGAEARDVERCSQSDAHIVREAAGANDECVADTARVPNRLHGAVRRQMGVTVTNMTVSWMWRSLWFPKYPRQYREYVENAWVSNDVNF